MPEDFEEQSFESIDLQRVAGVVRRRHLYFLIPMFVGWLAVWGASWVIPPTYRSGTLILVEQPSMPKDYVTPNVSENLGERLQSITQQILSRTRLLYIIDRLNLYGGRARSAPDDLVERMRKDIDIELVRDSHNDQITAFNVFYSARDPNVAQQVTSELTNLFINENLEVRQQQSEGTTKFLESQLENARQNLAEQEAKIRDFRAQHIGELPGQLGSNLQILAGLQSQLQAEEDALNTAKQQRVYLQTTINQYRTLQPLAKTSDGVPVGQAGLEEEQEKQTAELGDLYARGYTDMHPDVRKLKGQLAKTEKMIAELKSKSTGESSEATVAADVNPASPLAQLQGQLQANQVEIKNRENAIAGLKTKINEYQARLNQEPMREQQLADLTRGYDQSKANYDDLLKKKNESAMATSMEMMQQGERFRILDPPSLPVKPDFPNRLKLCGIGLFVGVFLGVVVTGASEVLDDRLYNEKEIRELVPVSVISEIPVIVNPVDERSSKARIRLGWATAGLVFVVILAGSAFSFLHG